MYHDRILRGNTYAILKNANRNIDTNIKAPTLKQVPVQIEEVYLSFVFNVRESTLWNKTKISLLLEPWTAASTALFKLKNMWKCSRTSSQPTTLRLRLIFILTVPRIACLCLKSTGWISLLTFMKMTLIFLILIRKFSLSVRSCWLRSLSKAEWK